MSSWSHNSRGEDRKDERPPNSRIFVVCSKLMKEDDLRVHFEEFGDIEDLYMPRDRTTGDPKGIAYIKFAKTSSAAAAIQELHLKTIAKDCKPIKVMVACSRNDTHNDSSEDRYKRLFIKIHRQATEDEIKEHFSQYGYVESVHIQKHKSSDENKGFAYVNYNTFLEAARAFEGCDRKYRPVFATPKDELKRSRSSIDNLHSSSSSMRDGYGDYQFNVAKRDSHSRKKSRGGDFNTVWVQCMPQVPQKCIERLFNIIPGMVDCQYSLDTYNGVAKAIVSYEDESGAATAVERINNFEFPSGEVVFVNPNKNPITRAADDLTNIVNNFKHSMDSGNPHLAQLVDAIAQASTLIKAATTGRIEPTMEQDSFSSLNLPPKQPMVTDGKVAQRCFIVCKPQPLPVSALRDIFCRFGDLIDVSTFPNKTFGFAKYASVRAAQEAIRTLNGMTVFGVKFKVIEADEKSKDKDGDKNDMDVDENDRKRMRLEEDL